MARIVRRLFLCGTALLAYPLASSLQAEGEESRQGPARATVTRVGLSADGRRAVTTDSAGRVRVWDMERGQELCKVSATRFVSANLSPDGRFLAISDFREAESVAALRESDSGKLLWEKKQPGYPQFYFTPDGRSLLLVAAIPTRRARFTLSAMALPSEQVLWSMGQMWDQAVLAVSPAADLVAVRTQNNAKAGVTVKDLRTGAVRAEIQPEHGPVRLAFSADGKQLAVAGLDGSVELWETSAAKLQRTLPAPSGKQVHFPDLRYSPTEALLVTSPPPGTQGSFGGELRLWNSATGQPRPSLQQSAGMEGPLFSPDGKLLAASSPGGALKIWSLADGAVLQTFELSMPERFRRADLDDAYRFTPDGRVLVTVSPEGVRRWDVRTGKQERSFDFH